MAPADGERRLTSAMRWSPGPASDSAMGRGAGADGHGPPQPGAAQRVQLRDHVGEAPGGDLGDDAGPSGRAGPGGRRSTADRTAVMPAPGRAAAAAARAAASALAALGAQPGQQLRPPARRRSRAPPCRCRPPAGRPTPATSRAAPALSSTTSRRAPGSPRSTASTIRAFCSGGPARELRRRRAPEAELRGLDRVAHDPLRARPRRARPSRRAAARPRRRRGSRTCAPCPAARPPRRSAAPPRPRPRRSARGWRPRGW